MTFASEAAKPNSKRFTLCKIIPARNITSDLSLSGGVYQMSWSYNVDRVERLGTALTEDSTTPTVNDHWYWDSTNSVLKIKLASAPSATNVIIVFYCLYYTTEEFRIATEDPEDSNTSEIHWEPRLSEEPSITQDASNAVDGVISSSLSGITIDNSDRAFQAYMTDTDSFYNKEVICWLCINGVSNIQKYFTGKIRSMSIGERTVSFSVADELAILDQPCLMGDEVDGAYWLASSGSFPNMHTESSGTPIPYVALKRHAPIHRNFGVSGNQSLAWLESLPKAVCTNYTVNGTGTDNRVWGLCRYDSNGPRTITFGTVTTFDSYATGSVVKIGVVCTGHNIGIGDTMTFSNGGGNDKFYVYAEDITIDIGLGSTAYTLVLYTDALATSYPSNTYADETELYSAHNDPAIIISSKTSPGIHLMYQNGDFTTSETTLSSGNKYQYITFANSCETFAVHSGFFGSNRIDPDLYDVYYITGAATASLPHQVVVQEMLEQAGLTVNSAAITAAGSALSVNMAMTIPYIDETEFRSYREYLQDICRSTMAILSMNQSAEAEYLLLSTPSSSDTTDDTLYKSVSVDVEYQDIITELTTYNPHYDNDGAAADADSPIQTISSLYTRYLHGIINAVKYRHVLQGMSNRAQDIFDILSKRRAIYRFDTATDNLTSEIGDDLQLDSDQILGGSGTQDLTILAIEKSAGRTIVSASDLLDI